MGGLLDKANKVAGDYHDSVHQGDNVVNDPEAIINAYERGKKSVTEKGANTKPTKSKKIDVAPTGFADSDNNLPVDKRILVSLQVGGAIALLISLFWLVQTGWLYATFIDYLVAITLMILGWILYNASDFLGEGLSSFKMGATAVVFAGLFITTVLGTIFINAGGGVTIAAAKLDGTNDQIDLSFYGPGGMEFTVDVLVDGEVKYSKDLEIERDRASHSIDLDEVWEGNAKDRENNTLVTYEIRVTSDGEEEVIKVNDFMNREVDTGFVRVSEIFTTDTNTGDKTYQGIEIEMIIGIGTPGANYAFTNGFFTGTPPKTVVSDWTATLSINGGKNYASFPSYEADEGFMSGVGDFWSGWVSIPVEDGSTNKLLQRDNFYEGDGCYTFVITITNVLGEEFTDSSSKIKFFWDENEANQGNEDSKSATSC